MSRTRTGQAALPITHNQVLELARLARIDLDKAERPHAAAQVARVVHFMHILRADSPVGGTSSSAGTSGHLRPDIPTRAPGQAPLLAHRDLEEHLLPVPQIHPS